MENTKIRFEEIDAIRGLAIVQMVLYHLCYDLNYFGWTRFALGRTWGWQLWQISIVSTFLVLVGVGLVLRHTFKPNWHGFWQRWGQIAIAALCVSVGSYFIFPHSYIFFGILHCIAISLLLARLLLFGGWANIPLGSGAIALGYGLAHPIFNHRLLNWIGFVTERPFSEDYVPLFPWVGWVLVGCGIGSIWKTFGFRVLPEQLCVRSWLPRWLPWLGRHSLAIYLVHQPILFALLWIVHQVYR